jgi:hypothetical protein
MKAMALRTADTANTFWERLVVYINDEYSLLVSFKLLTKHILLLLSNQVVQICDDIFEFQSNALVHGLYSSWSCKWWLEHNLQLVVVAHANFGGVMSAIHLIAYQGMADSCFRPHKALAQTLAHTINTASIVRAPAIDPLEPIETPPPRQPVVSRDLLHGEGLFDISCPKLEIACRSVFTPSSWVQQWLTPKEYLWVFDVLALLTPQLLDNQRLRSLLLRSLLPLVVASIFCSVWVVVGGGRANETCLGNEVQISEDLHMVETGEKRQIADPNIVGMEMREDNARAGSKLDCSLVKTFSKKCRGNELNGPDTSSDMTEPLRPAVQAAVVPTLVSTSSLPEVHETILDKVRAEHDMAKAIKANDTQVPVYLWNKAMCGRESTDKESKALSTLRYFLLRVYRRRLWREIRSYMASKFCQEWLALGHAGENRGAKLEVEEMEEILWWAAENKWFEYPLFPLCCTSVSPLGSGCKL